MSASLEEINITLCRSIGRIVLCGEGGSLEVLDQSEGSLSESTDCSPGVLLLPNALKKLKRLDLLFGENLVEIQVIGTLLSLQSISIHICDAMEKLTGISNLKNLRHLHILKCSKLWVVEGLDKLEFLIDLDVRNCPSLETLLDISNSKIPDDCQILVSRRRESLNSGKKTTFKHYKELMIQQGAPKPETNKEEAKMEGDAKDSHRLKKYILNLTTACFCKS
ncbi:uncharacterized protein LOC108958618 [Eucalyptus grandis]|uniref:uncharacterized protein LOC108958618 n=1 Tax=Eucalyptus grandis TaxID=71139 RepID=UPI00192EA1D8|nr:uncharacterized protein LOC108958618 [Eucalyptus grandis]